MSHEVNLFSFDPYKVKSSPIYVHKYFMLRVKRKLLGQPLGSAKRFKSSKRVLRRVTRSLRPEVKYLDGFGAVNPIPAGGSVITINQPAEGSDRNQRVGRKISGQYIQLDIIVTPPLGGAGAQLIDWFTAMLVYDRTPAAVAPIVGDILDVAVVNPATSFKALDHGNRFTIVRTWKLGAISATSSLGTETRIVASYKIPSGKALSVYNAAAAGVPYSGGWHLLVISQNNTGNALSSCICVASTRYAWIDV